MYSIFLSLSVSLVFPDPSLSPDNLSTVLDSMDDDLWDDFGQDVNIPYSEIQKIDQQSSGDVRKAKQQLISVIISTLPWLSWRIIANALYQMVTWYVVVGGVGVDSCHRALDRLQQLFPTGNVKYLPPSHGENLVAGAYPRGLFVLGHVSAPQAQP